eukprot:GEMP01017000.1.p1 GENE.GEMP01017000.1~~GEMP01017000.1.p1  ORF type:complete len:477 (+),score=57.67 GEMP01017000.1:191-1621(+)
MVTRFESPQLQQSVQHWKDSQQRSDSLKQWALALGVPAVLLYIFRPATLTTPMEDAIQHPTPSFQPVEPTPPAESPLLPPISPVLLVLILFIFGIVASRVFRHRMPQFYPAPTREPLAPARNPYASTPRVVDVQPGELCNFGQYRMADSLNTPQSTLWPSQRTGATNAFQQLSSSNTQQYPNQMTFDNRATNQYTPIPQASTEGLFSKHWASQSTNSHEETYKEFPEVVEMGMQLMEIVEKSIIQPLLAKLDQSDRIWESELARVGLKFVTYDPSLRSGDRQNANVVSVFDRFLPQPLANHQMAADAWAQRQSLEVYFVHPSFSTACRNYVIQRLRDWTQRGLRYGYRCFEKDISSGITDGHIVENLLVKMLDSHTDFSKKYLHTPSLASSVSSLFGAWGGLGSQGTVFLKPVRSDTVEYEVQTADGVRKLKPGDRNIFEAFSLFFLLKGRDRDSRALHQFPQSIQALAQTSTRPW